MGYVAYGGSESYRNYGGGSSIDSFVPLYDEMDVANAIAEEERRQEASSSYDYDRGSLLWSVVSWGVTRGRRLGRGRRGRRGRRRLRWGGYGGGNVYVTAEDVIGDLDYGGIGITFKDGSYYEWHRSRVGQYTVDDMIDLAESGSGLGSFIYRHVRFAYSDRSRSSRRFFR